MAAVPCARQGLGWVGPLRSAYQLSLLVHPTPRPLNSHYRFVLLHRYSLESLGSVGSLEVTYLPGQKLLSTEEKSICASLRLQIGVYVYVCTFSIYISEYLYH